MSEFPEVGEAHARSRRNLDRPHEWRGRPQAIDHLHVPRRSQLRLSSFDQPQVVNDVREDALASHRRGFQPATGEFAEDVQHREAAFAGGRRSSHRRARPACRGRRRLPRRLRVEAAGEDAEPPKSACSSSSRARGSVDRGPQGALSFPGVGGPPPASRLGPATRGSAPGEHLDPRGGGRARGSPSVVRSRARESSARTAACAAGPCTNSSAASAGGSVERGYSCSIDRLSRVRLVASTRMSGHAASSSATIGGAAGSCSRLSSTSSNLLERSSSRSSPDAPTALAIVGSTRASSVTGARGTNHTPFGQSPIDASAASRPAASCQSRAVA